MRLLPDESTAAAAPRLIVSLFVVVGIVAVPEKDSRL